MDRIAQMAFEMFADAYPIEAADADWPAFVAYAQRRNPEITEPVVRGLVEKYRLEETKGASWPDSGSAHRES